MDTSAEWAEIESEERALAAPRGVAPADGWARLVDLLRAAEMLAPPFDEDRWRREQARRDARIDAFDRGA